MLKRRNRANILLIALVVIFGVVTLLLMLFQVTSTTWTETMRTEAELETQQLIKFRLFQAMTNQTIPDQSRLGIKLNVQTDQSLDPSLTSAALFKSDSSGWNGLPDLHQGKKLSYDSNQLGYAGHQYFDYQVTSGAPRMEFGAITSQAFPFALMTCSSAADAVQAERLVSWKDPLWGASTQPLQEYASTAPCIIASGAVAVQDMPYGEVVSSAQSTLKAASGTGAVAFQISPAQLSSLPCAPAKLASNLRQQIQSARQKIVNTVQNVDKSLLFKDGMSPTDGLGLFFSSQALSQKFNDHLSVRQSQGFWLPTIPAYQNQFVIVNHFVFHIPASPDGGLSDLAREAQSMLSTLMELVQQFDAALQALQEAQSALDSAMKWASSFNCSWWDVPCQAAKAVAEAAVATAEAAVMVAEIGVEALESAILVLISPVTDSLEAILAISGQMPVPATRNEEKNYKAKTGCDLDSGGMSFWAYRAAFNSIGKIAEDLFSGHLSNVGTDLSSQINVTLFGQMDKKQKWDFSNGTTTRSTLNVPSGRSFFIDGNLNLEGDLWIGRGSSMVVNGDLNLAAGDTPTGGGPAATGRLYLEEGANLSVTGSITATGTLDGGSVVIASPLAKLHEINCAIFCGGNFKAPFGIFPGVAADDLAVLSAGPTPTAQRTQAASGLFAPVLGSLGPNLAKIRGPFVRRFPYIARYATTFEWLELPEDPIPFVIPESFPNLHVLVFRGLSALYAPTLNFEVGENFLTHTDWWGTGGEGRAPIFVKPLAVAIGKTLGTAGGWSPNCSVNFSSTLSTRQTQTSADQVDRFSNSLCIALASVWSQAITSETGIPLVGIGDLISKVLDKINNQYYNVADRENQLDSLIPDSSISGLTDNMTKFWVIANGESPRPASELPQECPGVLIYSGSQIQIGTATQRAQLASGWFVAESDIALMSDVTVGAATCLGNGSIKTGPFYYFPSFTKASLWLTNSEDTDWRKRGVVSTYAQDDSRSGSDKAVDIGFPDRVSWFGPRVR